MTLEMVDFSAARPPLDELHELGIVTVAAYLFGPTPLTRDYVATLLGAGFAVVPIFETTATRPWDTGDPRAAGRSDAAASVLQAERIGLGDAAVMYAFGDTPNVAPHLDAIYDYALGVGTIDDDRFSGYGAELSMRTVLDAVGTTRCSAWWGVETWIADAWGTGRPGHEQHNAELWRAVGANVVQLVGPSPIPGTDLNDTLTPYYGQWPGPAPSPPTTTTGDTAMVVEEVDDNGHTVKWWLQSGAGFQVLDGGANPSPTGFAMAIGGVPVFRGCHSLSVIALGHDLAATARHSLAAAPPPGELDDRGWSTT